jgi:hypothetical protein
VLEDCVTGVVADGAGAGDVVEGLALGLGREGVRTAAGLALDAGVFSPVPSDPQATATTATKHMRMIVMAMPFGRAPLHALLLGIVMLPLRFVRLIDRCIDAHECLWVHICRPLKRDGC